MRGAPKKLSPGLRTSVLLTSLLRHCLAPSLRPATPPACSSALAHRAVAPVCQLAGGSGQRDVVSLERHRLGDVL